MLVSINQFLNALISYTCVYVCVQLYTHNKATMGGYPVTSLPFSFFLLQAASALLIVVLNSTPCSFTPGTLSKSAH